VVEDKARDRVESGDSGRERNAGVRPQGPDACLRAPHRQAARMDFFNGLLRIPGPVIIVKRYSAYPSLTRVRAVDSAYAGGSFTDPPLEAVLSFTAPADTRPAAHTTSP